MVVVAAGSCDRSFQRAIAPKSFLREAPLALRARGTAWWRQTLIYLLRIPRPMGHSNQRVVLAGSWFKPPHPGAASSWLKGEGSRAAASSSDRTTADESWRVKLLYICAKWQATWAEDRALRGRNLSAVPVGQDRRAGGHAPPSPFLSEIGLNAMNPGVWGGAPEAMPFRRLDTRRMFFVCSTCAR